VARIRARAARRLWHALARDVTRNQRAQLDALLIAGDGGRPSPNNSSDRPKSAQATKHLGQRFHCKKLHQTAHSHSCERYQRLGFDRAFLVNNAG